MKRLLGVAAFLAIAAAALLAAGGTAQAVPVPASPDQTPTIIATVAVGSRPDGVAVNRPQAASGRKHPYLLDRRRSCVGPSRRRPSRADGGRR